MRPGIDAKPLRGHFHQLVAHQEKFSQRLKNAAAVSPAAPDTAVASLSEIDRHTRLAKRAAAARSSPQTLCGCLLARTLKIYETLHSGLNLRSES